MNRINIQTLASISMDITEFTSILEQLSIKTGRNIIIEDNSRNEISEGIEDHKFDDEFIHIFTQEGLDGSPSNSSYTQNIEREDGGSENVRILLGGYSLRERGDPTRIIYCNSENHSYLATTYHNLISLAFTLNQDSHVVELALRRIVNVAINQLDFTGLPLPTLSSSVSSSVEGEKEKEYDFSFIENAFEREYMAYINNKLKSINRERTIVTKEVDNIRRSYDKLARKLSNINKDSVTYNIMLFSKNGREKDIKPKINRLNFLIDNGYYEKFEIERNRINGYTMPITISYRDVDFELGCYKISFDLLFPTGEDIRVEEYKDNLENGYIHPHIHSEGDPCFGGIGRTIEDLCNMNKFSDIFSEMYRFLISYNQDSILQPIEYYDNKTKECMDCDEYHTPHCIHECGDNVLYITQDCKERKTSFCFNTCEYNKEYCQVTPCDGCRNDISDIAYCIFKCEYNKDERWHKRSEISEIDVDIDNPDNKEIIERLRYDLNNWNLIYIIPYGKSTAIKNELHIDNIKDLIRKTRADLLTVHNIGSVTIDKIEYNLAGHGLRLGMSEEMINKILNYNNTTILSEGDENVEVTNVEVTTEEEETVYATTGGVESEIITATDF